MASPLFTAVLALLLAGCGHAGGPLPWSSATDPTVGRPGDDTGPVDADGDGWTPTGGDCDDRNPEVRPDADELCTSGVDEDCDGLLDCEDGDCAYDRACWEDDCHDRVDGDGDGLVDCRDEDCWGRCTAVSRVRSGGRARWRNVWSNYGGNFKHGSAHTVDGTVRVGGTASTAFSCTWHAAVVTFECHTSYYYGFWWVDADRAGFALSPACPLPRATTAFLPGLCPRGSGIAARGTSPFDDWVSGWYRGDRTLLQSHERTISGFHCGGTSSWSMSPIESGNPFSGWRRP